MTIFSKLSNLTSIIIFKELTGNQIHFFHLLLFLCPCDGLIHLDHYFLTVSLCPLMMKPLAAEALSVTANKLSFHNQKADYDCRLFTFNDALSLIRPPGVAIQRCFELLLCVPRPKETPLALRIRSLIINITYPNENLAYTTPGAPSPFINFPSMNFLVTCSLLPSLLLLSFS